MALQHGTSEVRWKIYVNAGPEQLFDLLATDEGRERFWVEGSQQVDDSASLLFPDGTRSTMRIVSSVRPRLYVVDYFDTRTTFTLHPTGSTSCVLEVIAENLPADDILDVSAGWVSVLMNLKAVVNCGCDLRNHDASRSWRHRFVDN